LPDKPIKILLVEDSPGDARLLEEMLAAAHSNGFELVHVEDLGQATQRLATGDIGAVLLDLTLPDSSGLETFVKAQASAPQVPIIVMTGLHDEELAVKAVREGAQDYLVKGNADGDRLVRAIRYAIERKRSEEEARLRTQELEALFKIASILNQPMTFDEKANQVLEELLRISQVDRVTLRVSDEEIQGLRLVSSAGRADMGNPEYVPFDHRGISGLAFQQGNPVVVNDYASHPLAQPSSVQKGLGSLVSLPIVAGSQTLGVINIAAREPHSFPPDRVKLLTAIGEQLGALLENARLSEELQASTEEMAVVDEVARIITSTLDIDQVYEQFAAEVKKLVDFDCARISIIDSDNNELKLAHVSGQAGSFPAGASVPLEGTVSYPVMKTRHSLILDDLAEDTQYWSSQQLLEDGLRSEITVPLICNDRVIATLVLLSQAPNTYGAREQRILERLANQIAPSVENSRLYEEVKQLALALESIGDCVVFLDTQGEVQFANKSFQEKFGYSSDEVSGKHISIFTPTDPDSQAEGLEIFLQAKQKGWSGEVKRVNKNGEEFDIHLTITPVRNPEGGLIGTIGVVQDITERKRAEEQLHKLSRAVEQSPSGLMITNTEGKIEYLNPKFTEITGYTSEELVGKKPGTTKSGKTSKTMHQRLWDTIASGNEWRGELLNRKKNGDLYWAFESISHIKNDEGSITHFFAVEEDITERKQAEEVLRLRTEELEALFNIASTLAQPGTFEERYKGVLKELARVSETQRVILRVPDEEKQGLRLVAAAGSEINGVPPRKLIPYGQSISGQTFQTGEPFITNDYPSDPRAMPAIVEYGVKSEAVLPIKSGGEVLAVAILTSREAGHFTPERVRLLTAIGDGLGVLMENARLQEEITLGQELEQRRDAFVSIASHELRTPMTTILGFSELLLRRNPPEATRREWVERIYSHCARLAGIVDDLLNVSRIQSGKLAVNPEQLPLPVVVEEAVEAVRSTTDIHEFMLGIPPDTPKVVADPDKLAQVLTNLLTNAVKYSPGGGKITVSARLEAGKDRVVIAVADQGLGISRQDRVNLFTTFHRIRRPETDGISGTGLGLYIVKELVELMQGQVWLKSQLGKGSTFSFSIPTKWHKSRSQGAVSVATGGKYD